MPVNQRSARRALVPLLALCLTAAVPTAAYASGGKGGGKPLEGSGKGGTNGRTIYAESRIVTVTGGGSRKQSGTGTLTPTDSDWTPPACWYEPAFSPKQLAGTVKALRGLESLPFIGGAADVLGDALDKRYKDGEYKNYNLDKQGKGMFWAAVKNKNRLDDPEVNSCTKPPFWVDEGDTPDEPLAVSPRILAEYAYDELPIPGTEVTMAPAGETKVNLPTWVWLDRAKFRKVSATASLPGTSLSATTTAEPVSLRIEPGTKDARTYPASGECALGEGGRIGEPWARGKAKRTPPCGVEYLRSSGDGSYALKATVTWKIRWTSTNGAGEGLPDGEFGADQDVVVKEIQAVNR